jgi:hypothetical protein
MPMHVRLRRQRRLYAGERRRVRLLVQLPSEFEHHLWVANHA